MPDITLTDLIAWEPRLRPLGLNGAHRRGPRRRLGRARAELGGHRPRHRADAAAVRGGELVLLPRRVLAEAGVALPVLMRELSSHGVAAIVLDAPAAQPSPVPVLLAESLPPDFETELNRLLTERRGELYRAGTDLGRLLTNATAAGADLGLVLGTAATFLGVPAAVVDGRGALLSATADEAPPSPRTLAAVNGLGRGWREERFLTRLAGGEALWIGPVPKPRRALARLAAERIAVAAEAAIQRAAEARPRGPARATALDALLTGSGGRRRPAGDDARPGRQRRLPRRPRRRGDRSGGGPARPRRHRHPPRGRDHRPRRRDPDRVAPGDRPPVRPAGPPPSAAARRRRGGTARPRAGWPSPRPRSAPPPCRRPPARPATSPRSSPPGWPPVRSPASITSPTSVPTGCSTASGGRRIWPAFAADALGDLPARDRRGTLRATLLAYLATGGSHVDAAARLGIHRNTLSYRLKQIAALTGREPTDPSTQLVLHLALLAASLPPAP